MNFNLTHENKFYYFAFLVLVSVFGYLIINHNPFFVPQLLPFTTVDEAIPFIPESIWIYASLYPMMIVCFYLLIDELEILEKGIKAFFLLQIVSFTIFLLYPTVYPRHIFPLQGETGVFTKMLFESIRQADLPLNCFPSLHVGNCFICFLFVWNLSRYKALPLLIWSLLVAFSTISTKQHYFYDVVSGMTAATFCYWMLFKKSLPTNSLQPHK
ncbi:MAG: phosphatase PAP2 family protein [Bacteriovoracaceae bacterium]